MHWVQELAATRGYYRDWVSQGFKEEEVYFKLFKDVIQHSWEWLVGLLDSTYHQSQLKSSWLKMVPLGQRKDTG